MAETNLHKLSPRLRQLLLRPQADGRQYSIRPNSGKQTRVRDIPVTIEVADRKTLNDLKTHPAVGRLVEVVDGYCTAIIKSGGSSTVLANHLQDLLKKPGIVEIEAAQYYRAQLLSSFKAVDGVSPGTFITSSRHTTQEGSGVVVGIVDYGLDYTLPAFQDENGQSRVAYLWDQQLRARRDGRAPRKYGYGVEYSQKDIQRALNEMRNGRPVKKLVKHNPRQPEEFADVNGHGTFVAGIAAGKPLTIRGPGIEPPAGEYGGVAPGATLVFVNLNRGDVLEQIDDPEGTLANSVELIHAIAYCFERAEQMKMPCVVNLSMGFNGGGHDGNTAVEWIIDALLARPGRAVVAAAGNENPDNKRIYYGGTVPRRSPLELHWYHGEMQGVGDEVMPRDDPSPNELEVWYSHESALRVRLIAPENWGHDATPPIDPGQFVAHSMKHGELVEITSYERTSWHGDARIHIRLAPETPKSGIREGKWVVKLEALRAGPDEKNGRIRIDAWVERTITHDEDSDHLCSELLDHDGVDKITLTTPATARRAISVGSFDNTQQEKTISPFSGRGPTRTGPTSPRRHKPEVVAPGEQIWCLDVRSGRTRRNKLIQVSGTSMAAPHVTGVIARLLARQHYLSCAEIREILAQTARHPSGVRGKWDEQWGYGIVNPEGAMQLLEKKLA